MSSIFKLINTSLIPVIIIYLYNNLTYAQEKIPPPDPETFDRVISYVNTSDTAYVIEKSLVLELLNSINRDSKEVNTSAEKINAGNDIAPLELLNKSNLWLQNRLQYVDGLIAMFFYNNVELKALLEKAKTNLDILNTNIETCTNNLYVKNINIQTVNFIRDVSYNAIIAAYPGSQIILDLLIKYLGIQK